jgi:hypothetical protein
MNTDEPDEHGLFLEESAKISLIRVFLWLIQIFHDFHLFLFEGLSQKLIQDLRLLKVFL